MWKKAWLYKRKAKKGVKYALRWYDERGRVRTQSVGPDKKLAERLRKEKEHGINSGVTREVTRITFEDFVREHLELVKGRLSERTVPEHETTLRQFRETCGPRLLADVSVRMVEEFLSARRKHVRDATVNRNLRTLKAVFNLAIKRGYLESNPFAQVKQVKEPQREIRVLSTEDIERLLEACPDLRGRCLVYLALVTGMRRGELCNLRWCDLDLAAGLVRIVNREGWSTKSRKNRIVGIPPGAVLMLEELRLVNDYEYVFSTTGAPPRGDNTRKEFAQIVKESGIKHATLHDLRRTFVTHLAMAGENEAIVQALAGHQSMDTTLKYYTKVFPEKLTKAWEKLPYVEMGARIVSKSYRAPSDASFQQSRQSGKSLGCNDLEWRARQESNLQPSDSKSVTLSN